MDGVGGDGHPKEAVATHHPVASAAPSAGCRDNPSEGPPALVLSPHRMQPRDCREGAGALG